MDVPDFITSYARNKRIALANEIKDRTKVYLDTKYWVLLRDSRLGRPKNPEIVVLLKTLEELVTDGSIICPFNAEILFEVIKQTDNHTRSITAELIDALSLSVCMIPDLERFQLELIHFVESSRKNGRCYELNELVWSKTAYVLGFVSPDSPNVGPKLNVKIQESLFDHMWTLGFVDVLKTLGPEVAELRQITSRDISGKLNEGKLARLGENSTFRDLFLSEVLGILDFHRETLSDLLSYLYQRETGMRLTEQESKCNEADTNLAKLIYHAFRLNKIGNQLPSIRIMAGLHAAIRSDTSRRYKPNDLADLNHAAAALPYCDIFLTEKSLSHMIGDGRLGFSNYFQCKTVHEPSDALSIVNGVK